MADEYGPRGVRVRQPAAGPDPDRPQPGALRRHRRPGAGPGRGGGGDPAAPDRRAGRVRPGRRVPALPRRQLPHRGDRAGRRRRAARPVTDGPVTARTPAGRCPARPAADAGGADGRRPTGTIPDLHRTGTGRALRRHQPGSLVGRHRLALRPAGQPVLAGAAPRRLHPAPAAPQRAGRAAGLRDWASPTWWPGPAPGPTS